jgi:drug/metabolite transporter (DMT)-like permease
LKNLSTHHKALGAVAVISITWGTTWLPSKLLVGDYKMPPLQVSGMRMLFAGIIYLTFFLFKGYRLPSPKQFLKIIFLALFFLVFSNGLGLMVLSYPNIGSGLGAVLSAMVPLWVAILTIFLFKKQKITPIIFTGLLFGFSGVVVIFSRDLGVLVQPGYFKPIIISMMTSITWSLGTILNAKKDSTIDPFYHVGWQMFIAGLILLAWSGLTENTVALKNITLNSWWCFLYLVIIGSSISFVSYIFALKHLPATRVAMYAYINPMVALIIGFFWRHETFNWYVIAGTLITLLGVYLVNAGFEKQKFVEE